MSKELDDIAFGLRKYSERFGPKAIVPATVLAVNGDDTVHVQLSDDAEIEDVRLRSIVKAGSKYVLVPKVGSIVQIGRIENSDEYLVIGVEEITKVVSKIDTLEFELNNEGLLLKKQNDILGKLITDLMDALSTEKHLTPGGPSTGLTPDSKLKMDTLKLKFKNLLRND